MGESKSELVYRELRERIMHGDFSAGHRLVLARLAESFDVSPVPVREALRRLEAEGLVRYTLNVGAEVVGVNQADYTETMQVLAHLEGVATALAAEAIDQETLDRCREINDEMRRVRAEDFDPVRFTGLNHDFHVVLCGACPNQHLKDLLAREWERMAQIRRSTFTYVPDRSHTSVDEHEALLDLVAAKAPAVEIEKAARRHKLATLEQFLASEQQSA